jgi:hypothetical protein
MHEDCIVVDDGATAEAVARTTEKQILKVEIMNSNSISWNLEVQEENAGGQIRAMQIAKAALLKLDNSPGGFTESKPDQAHKTEAISSNGAKQFQEISGIVHSQGLPEPVPQRIGSDLSPENLHSMSPSSNPQWSEYHPLAPPLHMDPSHTSPAHSLSATILPPTPDMMSTDNGVKSTLLSSDLRTFWDIFSRHARVLLECQGRDKIYDVRVLMRETSPRFFEWYTKQSSITTSVLVLELLNVNGQVVKTFRVYRGALSYFRLVQHCIWDTFWLSFSNRESDSISIHVSVPNDNSSSTTEVVSSTEGTDRHIGSPPLSNQSNGTARYPPRHESNIHTILN